MNFWGKLIGGFLGYMMGGFFGALIGAALGHQFDRGMANFSGDFSTGLGGLSHVEIQRAFFEATFSVMGAVAKADGESRKTKFLWHGMLCSAWVCPSRLDVEL